MTNWTDGAWIYATTTTQVPCAKCDEPVPAGERAAKVPGLTARGWAHLRCIPGQRT